MYGHAQFIPADFPLYEYDPPDEDTSGPSTRRWLNNWNGLIGAPAAQVILGWGQGSARVLVCTSGDQHDLVVTRLSALHIVIGGDNFPSVSRLYSTVQDRVRDMELHSSADDEWVSSSDGDPAAIVWTHSPDFIVGYKFVRTGTVFFAATGRLPFRVRVVENAQSYDLDPTQQFPLQAMQDRDALGRP